MVTTSTTEAELLSLAQAAKEAKFFAQLQTKLGIKLKDSAITIPHKPKHRAPLSR